MSLSAGTRLGSYEITAQIGAGGMGEVYKARDIRLDRSVAIKILPPGLIADPDSRTRLEREAKTVAALNHPHICALFDIGDHLSPDSGPSMMFLVMEYVAGETLAARLEEGPLPLEQALALATEIADALAAAHRQGIIHRDLKPGNVMLTKAGAKLLDFGLAKLKLPGVMPTSVTTALLGTRQPATAPGVLFGTIPYMAPEQLEGKEADARSDIFSFGLVLYEMLTGKRAFDGDSDASVIAAILTREPAPPSSVQPITPPALDLLVRQCLAKSPDDRPDTAHDVANNLRWMGETSGVVAKAPDRRRRARDARVGLVVAGLTVGMAVGAGLMATLRPPAARISLTHPSLDVRPADELSCAGGTEPMVTTPGGSRTAFAWTPNGQAIVFVGHRGGVQRLYVRKLDEAFARPLDNTEGAQVPAVSVDAQWVAFWAGGAIRKVRIGGGPVMDVATRVPDPPWGLAWDVRGRLFLGRGSGGSISMIPPEGGAPVSVTTVRKGELAHVLPWPLPDGATLLYTVRKRQWSWGDEQVVAQTVVTGARKVLLTDAADARYVPSGHLVFLRRGMLFAVPIDGKRVEVRGTPVAVLDTVAQALTAGSTDDISGAGQFSVAQAGALAWVPGRVAPYPDASLVTVDRGGQVSALPAPVRSYGPATRISPDGRRLAVIIRSLEDAGVWVYDITRGTTTLLAGGGEASVPIWSPDGRRVAFEWLAGGQQGLAIQPADATAAPQVLLQGDVTVSSFTRDGRHVAAVRESRDIEAVTIEAGQSEVQPLVHSPQHSARWPEFSPDGHWLAYASDVSGRFEVYVQPYPGPGAAEPVSVEGGWSPAWHPNGRELFFVSLPDADGRRRMMAVDFGPGAAPRIGRPHALFAFDPRELRLACAPVRCYDVTADGQRFYAVQTRTSPMPPPVTHISLMLNWLDELKTKVPVAR